MSNEKNEKNEGMTRANLAPGMLVEVIQKKDYKTKPQRLVTGEIVAILTSKPFHSRGCKVRLVDGRIGRVQRIIPEEN